MKVRFRLALVGVLLASTGDAAALAKSLASPKETRIAIARSQRPAPAPRAHQPGDLCNGGVEPLALCLDPNSGAARVPEPPPAPADPRTSLPDDDLLQQAAAAARSN